MYEQEGKWFAGYLANLGARGGPTGDFLSEGVCYLLIGYAGRRPRARRKGQD